MWFGASVWRGKLGTLKDRYESFVVIGNAYIGHGTLNPGMYIRVPIGEERMSRANLGMTIGGCIRS